MIARTAYKDKHPVTEYISNNGLVFSDRKACERCDKAKANADPCVRFFCGNKELFPSRALPIGEVAALTNMYIIVDPDRAQVLLPALNREFQTAFLSFGTSPGDIYIFPEAFFERPRRDVFTCLQQDIGVLTGFLDDINKLANGGNPNA